MANATRESTPGTIFAPLVSIGTTMFTERSQLGDVNVLTSACIPDDYDAYRMISELGVSNVNSVRILDSQSGRWQVASVNGSDVITGENFDIPSVAVILIDMSQAVNQWLPGE